MKTIRYLLTLRRNTEVQRLICLVSPFPCLLIRLLSRFHCERGQGKKIVYLLHNKHLPFLEEPDFSLRSCVIPVSYSANFQLHYQSFEDEKVVNQSCFSSVCKFLQLQMKNRNTLYWRKNSRKQLISAWHSSIITTTLLLGSSACSATAVQSRLRDLIPGRVK